MTDIVERIPVYINDVKVGEYELRNMFDKHGNGDGDDYLLLAIHYEIISRLYEAGYEVETASTIHNPYVIAIYGEAGERWREDYVHSDANWREIWESLPDGVKEAFRRLAGEGVHLTL